MDAKLKDAEDKGDIDVAIVSHEDALDPAAEKRLVRKLDMWLSPMMVLVFLVSYLDRSNIGIFPAMLDCRLL